MLSLYRRLLALRRARPALTFGDCALLPSESEVLQFERCHGEERLLIALNLGSQPRRVMVPLDTRIAEPLLSTSFSHCFDGGLAANEGLVLRMEAR